MELTGLSLIAGRSGQRGGQTFSSIDPVSGKSLAPEFFSATAEDVEAAMRAAHEAFDRYAKVSGGDRAALLREIAARLEASSEALVDRAHQETALPVARLKGEVLRTSNQMRLFASLVEEGSWVSAHIDTALPDRKPLPRPGLRSMLVPLGPVVVFGASNFPLAFSTAGGDTAAALAAGNPVVVKAHPAHPGTSEIAARIIAEAIAECGLPGGVFSHLFDAGTIVAETLVKHPLTKAVTFTGSKRVGRLLMDMAAQRRVPVPCFAEMSSSNPVFLLPGAFDQGAESLAASIFQSYTLGAGQFCTKPGIVFLPRLTGSEALVAHLEKLAADAPDFTMLTPQIAASYRKGLSEREGATESAGQSSDAAAPSMTRAALLQSTIADFLLHPELSEELFGPCTLIVHSDDRESMLTAARELEGHLTATLLGSDADIEANRDLISILEQKVGRLIFNGFPTGVEVSTAMVHGGPYPATSDSRFTSVGSQSILRFVRPRCYQNYPDFALPKELRDANPSGILRFVDGVSTREPLS